jgi:ubiquinone/menaquinone biosynthesis C-methylase UbiE
MASLLQSKWDRASRAYDLMVGAEEARFGRAKTRLFQGMAGRCLMVAAGTGHDFPCFPPDLRIVALDVSAGMLARARDRASRYRGSLRLVQADVQRLGFPDQSFDTAVTVCTFCSVPDPVRGLGELRRVLRPQGRLLLFEHVRSRIAPIGWMQDLMTPITRRLGPDMNRDTLANVQRAGFRVVREENVYLDIVKAVEAVPT